MCCQFFFQSGLSSADHTRKLSASIMCLVFGNDYTDQPTCSQFGKTKIFLKNGQVCLSVICGFLNILLFLSILPDLVKISSNIFRAIFIE